MSLQSFGGSVGAFVVVVLFVVVVAFVVVVVVLFVVVGGVGRLVVVVAGGSVGSDVGTGENKIYWNDLAVAILVINLVRFPKRVGEPDYDH